jgi:polyhydroxyalkanoate synthesis regulator phasin
MDEFKSEMDELKSAILASHQQIEKEFNEKLKKMIDDHQQQRAKMGSVQIQDNPKMGNLDQQVTKFISVS